MKLFKKLQGRMFMEGITQSDLADLLGKSTTYVSNRMRGKHEWELEDLYRIAEIAAIPSDEILTFFPRKGRMQ